MSRRNGSKSSDFGVEFVALYAPEVNHLTFGIMASLAEPITQTISDSTNAALAAAKVQGVKLGGFRARPKLTAKALAEPI